MEIIAVSKSVRIAPRKVRLIADSIRKQSIDDALASLSLINKRGTDPLKKTLKSAIANAVNNQKLDKNMLVIKAIEITEAPFYKRFRPSTRGRVHPYKRRGSHIKIVLDSQEKEEIQTVQKTTQKEVENGTKS
jgi:large subunit ribosomal protein L22